MLLEVEKLTKSFGGLTAVHNLDFDVREGEIVGFIGPNGSGKTTLFNLITGFLKPDSGRVRFGDKDITGHRPYAICRAGIARTFQLVRPFPKMTAVQNVMVGRIYGRDAAPNMNTARKESREILEFVGLGAKADIPAGTLTLAERKSLELSRALASRPKLLLLDEVMAGLNPIEQEGAMQLVRKVRDSGVTVVIVEHIIKAVLGLCERAVVIAFGEKIAEGEPRQVCSEPQVIEAYLGSVVC